MGHSAGATPRGHAGFTLVELLTALAIISILAAILFPVFARAREKGRQAACVARLLNIGGALRIYAADFCGLCPPAERGLSAIAAPGLVTADDLVCPSAYARGLEARYLYRAGCSDDGPPNAAVACDSYIDIHNTGSNFLFADGHVKWLKGTRLSRWARGEPGAPGEGVGELAKRQKKMAREEN